MVSVKLKQRICIISGLSLIALAGLFPPWQHRAAGTVYPRFPADLIETASAGERQPAGYHLIFIPPPVRYTVIGESWLQKSIRWEPGIDFSQLFLIWFVIAAGTPVAVYLFSRGKGSKGAGEYAHERARDGE